MNTLSNYGGTGRFAVDRHSLKSVLTSLVCGLAFLLTQGGCAVSGPATTLPGILYQRVDPGSHHEFRAVVEHEAHRAPMSVRLDPEAASISDYTLDLAFTVRDKGLHDTETIWTMTTIFLFTMYPASCGRFELTLSGDLYDRAGRRLKSWQIVEQDTAFLWLFQGDDCGSEPSPETIREAASKMLVRLYARMSEDRAFSGDRHIPADDLPLVYVNAVNGEELVHTVLKTDEPFPNYTTDAAMAPLALRIVKIEFEFVSPEQGLGSIMGRGTVSMMTIGLVSMCPKNSMILNAEVLGGDGTLLREYQYVAKKRASMSNYCAAPTDDTHPKLAARLLRKLLEQIRKDGLV